MYIDVDKVYYVCIIYNEALAIEYVDGGVVGGVYRKMRLKK